MKINRKVRKAIGVVLALTMAVTLLPTGFLGMSVDVRADVAVGDEMFTSFSSTVPEASSWYSYSSGSNGWGRGANQTADGYSYGLAFEDWWLESGTEVAGYAYYTVPSMPAGTYTLTCSVDSMNIGYRYISKTTVYPYLGGEQITDYSISPYVTSTWNSAVSVTDGRFSYTFKVTEDLTDYEVGFYVVITEQQQVHLGRWSLTCDKLGLDYELVSASEVNDVTVALGSSKSDILGALASVTDIVSSDGVDTQEETLDLIWDVSGVDTSVAGDYTATYSYMSEYMGTQAGEVTVSVAEYTSERAYVNVVTDSSSDLETLQLEWGEGNVPGTFESGTLSTTIPETSGFYRGTAAGVLISNLWARTDEYSARLNAETLYKYLYFGATDTATVSDYTELENYTTLKSNDSTFSYYEYTFVPSDETMYIHFANRYTSSTYYCLRAVLTGLDMDVAYTVGFYCTGVVTYNSQRYIYIDDIVVTWEDMVTTEYTTNIGYDYAGTYSVESTAIKAGTVSDTLSIVPTYVTADLVIEDNAYVGESDEGYTKTQAVPVTWDEDSLAAVDTNTIGTYTIKGTALYADTIFDVESTVTVDAGAITSDRACLEVATGDTTSVEVEVPTTAMGEIEWASGNVPGTFETGKLYGNVLTTNGFFISHNGRGQVSGENEYPNSGSYAAKLTASDTVEDWIKNLYYGATDSSSTLWKELDYNVPLELYTGYTNCTYTFTATAETMYLHFANFWSSSSLLYLRAAMTELTIGTEYTVSFYYSGCMDLFDYYYRYFYIDDVTVTYQYDTTIMETKIVPVMETVYYDYAGTYTVDTTTVEAGMVSDISTVIPSYIVADLVLEDNAYVSEGDDGYTEIQALPVTWDEASLAAVDTDKEGIYTITGTAVYADTVFNVEAVVNVIGEGDYYPVKWTSTDGNTYYVNGGNYVKGADISSVISLESAGTTFDYDVFQMLKDNGVNSVRIRIWNNPYSSSGVTYGGGVNDADVAVMIAQRAADVGMSVMLSFHLSDFWADPAAQKAPSEWSGLSVTARASET